MKLRDIYAPEELEDEREYLYHHLTEEMLEVDFEIRRLPTAAIPGLKSPQEDIGIVDLFEGHALPEQRDLVS